MINKIVRIVIITVLLLMFFSINNANAQTGNPTVQNPPLNTTAVSEELDYTLPYPGILLDHPLYLLKKIRDSVIRMFLNNPVKRIEFSLLQSDKYLAMAMAFADMGKWDRAGQAVTLSRKEMEQAITEVVTTRKSGVIVSGHIITSLQRSTVKHKQRIDEMKELSLEKPNGLFGTASDAFAQLAAQASTLRE